MLKLRFASILFLCAIAALLAPEPAAAQSHPQPTALSVSPVYIHQGECFTMSVGNGAGIDLDFKYNRYFLAGGSDSGEIDNWPHLDENGNAEICMATAVFTAIRNTQNGPGNVNWVDTTGGYISVTVLPPAYPNPSGLVFRFQRRVSGLYDLHGSLSRRGKHGYRCRVPVQRRQLVGGYGLHRQPGELPLHVRAL